VAKTDFKNIDEYHAACSIDAQARMSQIRAAVHEIVPEVQESISYQLPFFKYKGHLLYYAAFAKHISFIYPFSEAFLDRFATELVGYKRSKSVIQLPNADPFPIEMLCAMIAFRKMENDEKPAKK
jgi:uncharacterized protein YdhG (YjbR/CyaY superfamily)